MRSFIPALITLAACAAGPTPHLGPDSPAASRSAEAELGPWLAPLDRDHPLVGRVMEVATGRALAFPELQDQARRAAFVLVGESHDNADHHRLEAAVLDALISGGSKPGVVFEMLDAAKQGAIDRHASAHPADVDGLAQVVDWADSGWPDWSLYRPVFASAVTARLLIFAAGLDRALAMKVAREGLSVLDAGLVSTFGLDRPLEASVQEPLRQEMRDAHCGMLPEDMLDHMVLVQQARDALLAERMHAASAAGGGAVLIAGAGHVRKDRGVPNLLKQAYGQASLAIGLLEVRPGETTPEAYAAGYGASQLPFDYVIFTPRASDTDHCAEIRAHMQSGGR